MTLCQTILLDFDTEMKATRTLLERVPINDAHRAYKPHEKSMALDYLATHVAELPSWFPMTLESERLHLPVDHKMEIAGSSQALLALFDSNVAKARAAIDAASDATMTSNWTFEYGDSFTMIQPRTEWLRSFLNHLVHHRAQLGVYLRLLNIPIPGMYGPSADDAWK